LGSQFFDLYETVDGRNSYAVLLDIAQGREPQFKRKSGRYAFAASCVLRSFKDCVVVAFPNEADLERLATFYPDMRIELHGELGKKLSDELQDGTSYRYGIINLGGLDRASVLAQFNSCRERLGIILLPATSPALSPEAITQHQEAEW